MSRKNENKKGANGAGSIRKITTTRNGKEYTYWQGRYTEGYDACTGKQIQRSITGKTQKEVAQKLRQITAEIDAKTYVAPCKLSISEWMSIWAQDYLVGVKASTACLYKRTIELYIEPHFGHIRLDALNAHTVQHFYNELAKPSKPDATPLSAKSIKNIHGVLHKALKQAVLQTRPKRAFSRASSGKRCTLWRKSKSLCFCARYRGIRTNASIRFLYSPDCARVKCLVSVGNTLTFRQVLSR